MLNSKGLTTSRKNLKKSLNKQKNTKKSTKKVETATTSHPLTSKLKKADRYVDPQKMGKAKHISQHSNYASSKNKEPTKRYWPLKKMHSDTTVIDKINWFYQNTNKEYYMPETSESIKVLPYRKNFLSPLNRPGVSFNKSSNQKKKQKKIMSDSKRKQKVKSLIQKPKSLQKIVNNNNENTELTEIYIRTKQLLNFYSQQENNNQKQKEKILKAIKKYKKMARDKQNRQSINKMYGSKKVRHNESHLEDKLERVKMLYSVRL